MPSSVIPGKTCVLCGQPIPWRPGIPERARAKYCSEKCRIRHAREAPQKPCAECGQPIPWREGAAQRAKAKFCSNTCKFAYQATRPPRRRLPRAVTPCGTCGEPVEYLPSQKRPGAAVYCSRKCFGIGHSKTMTGRRPNGGIYTSPSTFRVMIRREFYDRCAICGWSETPCDVAHIVPRKAGGEDALENVTILCPNHHRMYDLGLIAESHIRETRASALRHG
jgi:endogenous inhibitor of DNA gyrase (YacG/DUF329 family)